VEAAGGCAQNVSCNLMRTQIIIFLLTIGRLFAQTSQNMAIKIVDGKTSKALANSIVVHSRNDTIVSTIQTDAAGEIGLRFLYPIKTYDTHYFRISADGFESQNIKITSLTKFPVTVKMVRAKPLTDINFESTHCGSPTIKKVEKLRDTIRVDN